MEVRPSLEVVAARDLGDDVRAEITALCAEAYGEDFTSLFRLLPGSIHVLARLDGLLVSHACWVTRWLQPEGYQPLRTAYVEAVATRPAYQRRGFASLVMRRVADEIGDYLLGALSPSDPAFYERLGWELWRGPMAIRTSAGLVYTPDEQAMIYRTKRTPPIEVNTLLTAEWREGELW